MLTSRSLREELFRVRDYLTHDPYHYFPEWTRDFDLESVADQPLIYLSGGTDHAMWLFLRHEKSSRFNRLAIFDESRAGTKLQRKKILDLKKGARLIQKLLTRGETFICINFAMEQDDYLMYRHLTEVFNVKMLDWPKALRLPTFKELQIGAGGLCLPPAYGHPGHPALPLRFGSRL